MKVPPSSQNHPPASNWHLLYRRPCHTPFSSSGEQALPGPASALFPGTTENHYPLPPNFSLSNISVSPLVLSDEWVPREILRKTRHPPVTPGCNKQPPRFSRMFYVSSLPPSHRREDPPFKWWLSLCKCPFPKEASAPVPMVTKTPWQFLRAEAQIFPLGGQHLNVNI